MQVNAHSLFSRWFSESGKLVASLFEAIKEKLDEPDALVFVLVDEVESLAASRSASAGEPSDAVRAVNALLTQLDQLRSYRNCMVLTTSNITGAIDVAFVDRADIKAYIGPPTVQARYEMLRSSLAELIKVGIVQIPGSTEQAPVELPGFEEAQQAQQALVMKRDAADIDMQRRQSLGGGAMQVDGDLGMATEACTITPSYAGGATNGISANRVCGQAGKGLVSAEEVLAVGAALLQVAQAADGLSGRTLRKLPFLAHAGAGFAGDRRSVQQFLEAMVVALEEERNDRNSLVQA